MAFLKIKLHWQILIALVLAVIAGILSGTEAVLFGVTFYSMFDFVGKLFLTRRSRNQTGLIDYRLE